MKHEHDGEGRADADGIARTRAITAVSIVPAMSGSAPYWPVAWFHTVPVRIELPYFSHAGSDEEMTLSRKPMQTSPKTPETP